MTTVIDASDHVLGRLASHLAKRLLAGETIVVVNAEKAVITGRRSAILQEYKVKRDMGTQRKGPFYPRAPERIVTRVVRGMLPRDRTRGREALKRLRVHTGVPLGFKGKPAQAIEEAKRLNALHWVYLGDVAQELGATEVGA